MSFVAVGVGAGVAVAGAAYGAIKSATAPGTPLYQDPTKQGLDVGDQVIKKGEGVADDLADKYTQYNIDEQNKVTPGSSQTRALANQQLQAYIQGYIPSDLQDQIQRQNAEKLGGAFNFQSGGGQAPQNFARNLGLTSVGLSQYGLSAAPAWQALANSMVQKKENLFKLGLDQYNKSLDYQQKNNEQLEDSQLQRYNNDRKKEQATSNYIMGAGKSIAGLGSYTSFLSGSLGSSGSDDISNNAFNNS